MRAVAAAACGWRAARHCRGGAGGWSWSNRDAATEVTTATIAAQSGGAARPARCSTASGYVTARRRATVSSKVTGKVLEVFVEEGKAVRTGQVLARLDERRSGGPGGRRSPARAAADRVRRSIEARLREAELTLTAADNW